jgi:hypothetical protein
MGTIYEELLRRFSEMSNEESGDHYTPRDIVRLLVSLVFEGDREDLQGKGKIRSIYDCCCGTGGMLTIGKHNSIFFLIITNKLKILSLQHHQKSSLNGVFSQENRYPNGRQIK